MDRSLKWRTVALLVGLLLCAGILAPTWPGVDSLPSWFPFKKQISLGLDLQGGMHIVYTIDLDKAVDDRASQIKNDLETRFTEDNITKSKVVAPAADPTANPPIPLGAVTISLADDKRRAEVISQLKADYGDTIDLTRPCAASDAPGSICLKVSESYGEGIKKAALANAVTTIRERINEKGVSEPSVVEQADNIIVELPGDPEDQAMKETRDIIAKTAKLEFKVVDENSPYMLKLFQHVGSIDKKNTPSDKAALDLGIKAGLDGWSTDQGGKKQDYFLQAYDRDETMPASWAKKHGCMRKDDHAAQATCKITGRQLIERYVFGDDLLGYKGLAQTDPSFKVPDDHELGFESHEPDPGAVEKRTYWRTYYLERAVQLTGASITNAYGSNEPNTGQPVVILDFNRFGSRVFGDLTTKIVGKKMATILDDRIRSAPFISEPIRGGHARISMGAGDINKAEREREELVNVLKTGSLPAPLHQEIEQHIGPTLGGDAIAKTKLSFIIGIILVIAIMVGIYKWSGFIAVFAVTFHIIMTLAVMALFGATLTLPGVAAIVLSIGMEVDGNILIYERIRDELLLGKSVRGAIDLGFSRAFSAILDGQLTTAAAGWVLLQYGSGPIKGFAVMLLVGVFTTLSTNIWVTRIFFDWYVSRKKGQLATISI